MAGKAEKAEKAEKAGGGFHFCWMDVYNYQMTF